MAKKKPDTKKKYYGDREILAAEKQKDGTVEISFAEGETLVLPQEMFEAAQTDEPIEPGELRQKRISPVAHEVLSVILKWDLLLDEMDPLFNLLITSVNGSLEEAEKKLWGVERSEKTFSDIDKVLRHGDTSTKAEKAD